MIRVITQRKGADPAGFAARLARDGQRRRAGPDLARVRSIVRSVREGGDAALYRYERRFCGLSDGSVPLRLSESEIRSAYGMVSKPQHAAVREAAARLAALERRTMRTLKGKVETVHGRPPASATVSRRFAPIDSVGCYIPGGLARYPSSAVMSIVPAAVAGVPRIVAVSPVSSFPPPSGSFSDSTPPHGGAPAAGRTIDPLTVVAADMCGATEIYRAGGAQAVAALAYGTESIPRVDKIVGPGGAYVTAAKSLVSADVGIDMLAGPTELGILADADAPPRLVALDLVSQAEHSEDTQCYLITDSAVLARRVNDILDDLVPGLGRGPLISKSLSRNGFIAVVRSMEDGAAVAHALAPEHLEIMMSKGAARAESSVTSPGLVLVGRNSPSAASDYLLGSNHVLPTNRTGAVRGSLSVLDYLKVHTTVRSTRGALRGIDGMMRELTHAEGLVNHYEAVRGRLKRKGAGAGHRRRHA
ncbi:MAG: histidinol dehydrogenase [Thaumarchaeota archaeon]|nr:histidinol dehydrogenase [Nitrososphaerota archaeon]